MIFTCEVCNNKFEREYRANRLPRFCSHACDGIAKKGKANVNWSGEKISRQSIHGWIRLNYKKPKLCQDCGIKVPYDLANISPTYNPETYTRDIKNWRWLCRSCHMKSDGRSKKLFENSQINEVRVCRNCSKQFNARFVKHYHCSKPCAQKLATERYFKRKKITRTYLFFRLFRL